MTELEFMREFGENLKAELKDACMSQKELSEWTGISESTISKYIHGELMPGIKNLVNIAVALDVDITDLATLDEEIK